jgi:hypothetical protein
MKIEKITMKSLDAKSKKECWEMSNDIIRSLIMKKSLVRSGTTVKGSELKILKKNNARIQTFINKK